MVSYNTLQIIPMNWKQVVGDIRTKNMIDTGRILYLFCLIHLSLSACVPSPTQCGCSAVKPLLSQTKIVGGYAARSHSWPWIVSLRHASAGASPTSAGSAFCGGTLIQNNYVVTAAHCFSDVQLSDLPNYFVVVGAQFRNDTNPVRFTIKSVTLNENYNSDTYDNDIALLELNTPVNFSDPTTGFICLPPSNIPSYPNAPMNATGIGWGTLKQGGSLSYTLQQVQLPIISYQNQYCANLVDNITLQFCAGFLTGGKDTCQGDSGGPLMIYDPISDTWNLAGITSYGDGCAQPNSPGIYTRVSMFVNWISAHMNGPGSSQSYSRAPIKRISYGLLLLFLLFMSSIFSSN